MSRRIRHGVDFNFAIDNLNDKRYWETQNYLESRELLRLLVQSTVFTGPPATRSVLQ